jgi:hypothetical protein
MRVYDLVARRSTAWPAGKPVRYGRRVGYRVDSGPGPPLTRARPTRILRAVSQEDVVVSLNPSANDPACPSCRKPIKLGTPVVLKGGQTLHLRCWTLMLRGQMTALERNRAARVLSRARQLRATGESDDSRVSPETTTPGPP